MKQIVDRRRRSDQLRRAQRRVRLDVETGRRMKRVIRDHRSGGIDVLSIHLRKKRRANRLSRFDGTAVRIADGNVVPSRHYDRRAGRYLSMAVDRIIASMPAQNRIGRSGRGYGRRRGRGRRRRRGAARSRRRRRRRRCGRRRRRRRSRRRRSTRRRRHARAATRRRRGRRSGRRRRGSRRRRRAGRARRRRRRGRTGRCARSPAWDRRRRRRGGTAAASGRRGGRRRRDARGRGRRGSSTARRNSAPIVCRERRNFLPLVLGLLLEDGPEPAIPGERGERDDTDEDDVLDEPRAACRAPQVTRRRRSRERRRVGGLGARRHAKPCFCRLCATRRMSRSAYFYGRSRER